MDIEKLLLAEYESARAAYREIKGAQDKIMTLFGTILIALVTFIVKGDLPKETYLLCAAVLFLSAAYISAMSYKASCLAGVLRISEKKLNRWAKMQNAPIEVFDLVPRNVYLRDGAPRKILIPRIHRHLAIVFLLVLYFFFIRRGLSALQVSRALYWVFAFIAVVAVPALGILASAQNRALKARFALLRASETNTVPLTDE